MGRQVHYDLAVGACVGDRAIDPTRRLLLDVRSKLMAFQSPKRCVPMAFSKGFRASQRPKRLVMMAP